MPDAQQLDDAQVLLALGHPTLVGGDHEHHDVHRTHAGEHVLDEPHVAGDVDEAHLLSGRQLRERESEVDGEAALLLLREPVGVAPRQGEDERRLAVIDVAGGGDGAHGAAAQADAAAANLFSRRRPSRASRSSRAHSAA